MIGGLNNTGLSLALPDPGGATNRREPSRGNTSYDRQVDHTTQSVPPSSGPESGQRGSDSIDQAAIQRRVEARQAAAESRLETFQQDQAASLSSSRALDAFTTIAGYQDGRDVELAGVSIRA